MHRVTALVFVASWLLGTTGGCNDAEYVQTDCEIADEYVGIRLAAGGSADEGAAHRSFVIEEQGVSFSVKPVYYAETWSHIKQVIFTTEVNSEKGVLSFKLLEDNGNFHSETVGVITRNCWEEIGKFVSSKSIDTSLLTDSDN